MRIIPDLKRLIGFIAHRRMIAFWAVAAVALPAPWLMPGCTSRMATESKNVYDNCQVLNVHDGDTMTVNCQGEKVKVRLYCIDAPELGQEPWGRGARDFLRSITGQEVQLVVKDRDRYGRIVAEVLSSDLSLNREMVSVGESVVYERYCNDKDVYSLQDEARRQALGVWSQPGEQQRPWAWRH